MSKKPNLLVKSVAAVAVAGALALLAPSAGYAEETTSRFQTASTSLVEESATSLASSLDSQLATDPTLSTEVQAAADAGDTAKVASLLGIDASQVDVVQVDDQQLEANRVVIVRVTCRQVGNLIICRVTIIVYD